MSRYLAFISYRHEPESLDASLRIRKGLEGHHLPPDCTLPRHRKVFRDTDELPTSSDLGMDIENALRDSDYLVTLCTEEYIHSKWCLREVEIFLELGRRDRILPVLVSGTPETSIPEALKGIPLAADLRENAPDLSDASKIPVVSEGQAGSYDKKKLRTAIPELLSLMSGMDAERIARAESRFRTGATSMAVAFITAGLLGFAGYASKTAERIASNNVHIAAAAEETEKEKRQAIAERDTALLLQARYLSEQAMQALIGEDTNQAIELALSALPENLQGDLPVSAEAEGVLRLALSMEMSPTYRFLKSVDTDFDITGYYLHGRQPGRILLTEDCFETAVHYVDYTGSIGIVETDFAESRQEALDLGYTKLIYLQGDVNSSRHVYYGGGKPLYSANGSGRYRTDYTLQGKPFCPEYLVGKGTFVAWEKTGVEGVPRMALFKEGTAEALAEFELTGVPVSVSPASNESWILVVDDKGTVNFYDFDGVCHKTLEGDYTAAYYYYNSGSYACLGSMDGTVTVLDLESFEEVLKFQCPSHVREINVNRKTNRLLICCDSGVYLYRFRDGSFVAEIGENAVPNLAIWKDDDGNASSDASVLLLLYDRRVEIYTMDTEIDSSSSEYHPLFHEGVPPGHSMIYSQDGQRIYQHSYIDDLVPDAGEDMLYCWDAYTGKLLWESANPRENYGSVTALSADGRTLWRIYEEGSLGVERLDAVTGEKLISVLWEGKFYEPLEGYPKESMDGTRAFMIMQYSSSNLYNRSEVFALFDSRTGELLRRMDLEDDSAYWSETYGPGAGTDGPETENGRILPQERNGFAEAMFSADGRSIYLVQNAEKKETGVSGVCIDRLDAVNGEILEEKFLEIGEQDIKLWEEEESVVLIDRQDERNDFHSGVMVDGVWIYPNAVASWEGSTVTHRVRIMDLTGRRPAVEVPISYRKSPEILNESLRAVQPHDGGMTLYWETENEDGDAEDFCCRLNRDGSVGTAHPADSEAGRRLWVEKNRYLKFNGQESYLTAAGIRRMSDGALLLGNAHVSAGLKTGILSEGNDTLESGLNLGIAAAEDGQSICMYDPRSSSTYPSIILPSDLDTLVEKGKRRLAR